MTEIAISERKGMKDERHTVVLLPSWIHFPGHSAERRGPTKPRSLRELRGQTPVFGEATMAEYAR